MDIFSFVQKFFVFLLPGILGMYLYSVLNIKREQHYYFEFLKIVMLSYASFLITDCLFGAVKHFFPCFIYDSIDITYHIGSSNTVIPSENVLLSVCISIFLACLLTKANSGRWLYRLANKLHISNRTDNQPVWEHIFDDEDVVVIQDYISKNTIFGKVIEYSDDCENREFYIESATVYVNGKEDHVYTAKKMYISRKHNEFAIEKHENAIETEGNTDGKQK